MANNKIASLTADLQAETKTADDPSTIPKRMISFAKGAETEAKEIVRQAERLAKAVKVTGGGRNPGSESTPSWNMIKDANTTLQSRARQLERDVKAFEKVYQKLS